MLDRVCVLESNRNFLQCCAVGTKVRLDSEYVSCRLFMKWVIGSIVDIFAIRAVLRAVRNFSERRASCGTVVVMSTGYHSPIPQTKRV